MDYRDVISQEFVNSLFSDMKSKYEKVSSHEYLEWLKNIIERHGKEEEEVFAITDDSDIWYDEWYEALSIEDKQNINCLSLFLSVVADKANQQGIKNHVNFNIPPESEDYNEFEVERYYFMYNDNLDNYTYCISLMVGQGSCTDVWKINKKDIPEGARIVKLGC